MNAQTVDRATARRMEQRAASEPCADCGHTASEHRLTEGHRMFQILAEDCEVDGCTCRRFTSDVE